MSSALAVRCAFCKAGPGNYCRAGRTTRNGFFHPTRVEAAHSATQPSSQTQGA